MTSKLKFNTSGLMIVVAAGLVIGMMKPALQADKSFSNDEDSSMFNQSSQANAFQSSVRYSTNIDPAAKQQLGEQAFNEITMFFLTTQKAIETKNMAALMAQYSENYRDGDLDKRSVAEAWQRIFSRVDAMAILNNVKFVNISADENMVVIQSSGLIVGVPEDEKWPVTIDNWNKQDHVLVKEAGGWKLSGIYGTERKRLWFDKPTHPLI
ncbi:MAG: nuclear transport factor 2 family protein [Gallionella sp.]|nr:nuclear transport factor 2 family protein [Gallionella sp.]